MLIVLTYDVDTSSSAGEKRLRRVAKLCEHYGMRVQNSVFELLIDSVQMVAFQSALEDIINTELDSVRMYRMGNSYQSKIITMGKTPMVQAGAALIF